MDRDGCRRAWLDLAPRKHRDRHGPMGPDDSSATAASKTGNTGLGNEDEITEAAILAKTAEVARFSRPGMAPVAKNHRELSAGDDDDRHLPGH